MHRLLSPWRKGGQPRCFLSCIGKIRIRGWVSPPDKAKEDSPLDYLVHIRKAALPLFPQLGLEPNVYYIPPVHVADEFLSQMFGPNAKHAVKTYLKAREDKTLAGIFTLMGSTDQVISYFKINGDDVLGFDDKRKEIVRVPIKEPVVKRPVFDTKLQVGRQNIS